MSFICMRMKNLFPFKGWALNLVLIQRPGGTRKWRIVWTPNMAALSHGCKPRIRVCSISSHVSNCVWSYITTRHVFICQKSKNHFSLTDSCSVRTPLPCIQLFRERLSENMCTRQSRKVIWDSCHLLLLLSFSTRKQSMASRAIVSNFFEKQCTQNHPQYPSGLLRALFPQPFSK